MKALPRNETRRLAVITRRRAAYTILESLIAMTLLAAGTATLAGMSMHRRTADRINLTQEVANDELIRMADEVRFGGSDNANWQQTVDRLELSDYTRDRLVEASMEAVISEEDGQRRAVLTLRWMAGGSSRSESVVVWDPQIAWNGDTPEEVGP